MSEKNKHGSSSDEHPDEILYVPQPKRERRNSSLASIGSNILEEIIEGAGAVLQEADKVPNMLNSYTECVAELYTIEKNLRDYQY